MALHERIAQLLGWTVEEVRTFSLKSVRAVVAGEPPSPERDRILSDIDNDLESAAHWFIPHRPKKR